MGGATELSLLKARWDLDRDFVGKREHELRGRQNYVQNRESLVFSLLCLLSQDMLLLLALIFVVVVFFPFSHTLPTSCLYCAHKWHLSVLRFIYLFSYRLHSSCPTSNHRQRSQMFLKRIDLISRVFNRHRFCGQERCFYCALSNLILNGSLFKSSCCIR